MALIKQRLSVFLFLLALCSGNLNAQTWAPEHQFSAEQGFIVHVAADNNGHAMAVWAERVGDSEEVNIWASYFSNGAWGPSVMIGLAPVDVAFDFPQVAMDATGNALAVWSQFDSPGIWAASFSGGTWGPQTQINTNFALSTVAVAMDGSGNGLAVWDASPGGIQTAFFNGSVWQPAITHSVDGQDPSVAFSSAGTALITWTNIATGEILSSFYTGLTWGAGATISTGIGNRSSDVGIAANGTGLAVWTNANDIFSARFNGAVWSAPVIISTGTGNDLPAIDVQPNGKAAAVWVDGTGNVQAALFNGSTWTAPTTISTTGFALDPDVAMDGNGNAVAVWVINNDPTFQVWSAFHPVGDTNVWLSPLLVATDTISLYGTDAAFSQGGVAFVVWNDDNGPGVSDTFGSFITAVVNFTGRSCRDRFAWQTDCVHILTWTPTADPTLIGYRLRRNGTVIANIPASGPYTFIDHNRCNQTDVYILTTVDALGVEGFPGFVTLR